MAQNYSYIAKELIDEGKKRGASSESLLKYLRDRDTKQGELPTILQLAKTDLTPFVNPTPLKKNEMITTGNLTEDEVDAGSTVAPVIRKDFADSLNEFDKQRVKIQDDEEASKIKTYINLRRLQNPYESIQAPPKASLGNGVRELISATNHLSLRESIARKEAIGSIIEKSIASGDERLLREALPKDNSSGVQTIQMTPEVQRIYNTPMGKKAIDKVASDLYTESTALMEKRVELSDAVEKAAENKGKGAEAASGVLGFGNKYLSGLMSKNTPPKKTVIDVPETGETLNVGEKPKKTVVGTFKSKSGRSYNRYDDGSMEWIS